MAFISIKLVPDVFSESPLAMGTIILFHPHHVGAHVAPAVCCTAASYIYLSQLIHFTNLYQYE